MSAHLSQELIKALRKRCRRADECSDISRHLASCERCRFFVSTLRDQDGSNEDMVQETPDSSERYSAVIDKVFREVVEESDCIEGQRLTAASIVNELRGFSATQQELLILNSARFRTWGVVEQLLSDCRARWSDDPLQSESLAHLALVTIAQMKEEGFRERLLSDLRAEAWSYVANCRRIRFDLGGAAQAFKEAEAALATGTGDASESARLMDLKASYFCACGQFEAAARALDSAIHSYRRAGDSHLEGRSFFTYSKVLYDGGHIDKAISALDRACELVDAERDPYLEFQLKWTKLLYLTRLGETEEASRLLPSVRELARKRAPRLERLRFLWTEAILCRKLGQLELAEEALMQVREGYIAAQVSSDVALVSLELASLYLEIGRTEEVRRLAIETLPLFSSRGVRREVLMAWTLFTTAAEHDAVTLKLVGEVATQISQATGSRKQ